MRVIQAVDLLEDIGNFAEGMQKNVGKMGTAVSGGQRKRIGLARALYLKDAILFVDGLAEAVDKKTEKVLIANILNASDRIIFVASDSEEIRKCASCQICI